MSLNQSPQSKINAVIALFSNDQLEYALEEALILVKDFPEDAVLQNIMGACYAGLGQLGSAVKSYEKAIEIDPNYAKAHYNLGGAYHELGQFEDSVKSYEKSIVIDPNYAQAHYNLGNVLKDFGHLDEAIVSYEKALVIKPDYVEAHYSLGVMFEELGQLNEMIEHFKQAVAIQPNLAEAHNRIGIGFEKLGQLDNAFKNYEKAILINPSTSEAHNNLGNVLRDLGRFDESAQAYKKAIEINPDYPVLHNNLGTTYKLMGQIDKAVNSYENAVFHNPDHPDSLNNLGLALFQLGRLDEAVKSFNRAIAIKPDYAEAFNNLGAVYIDSDQNDEAVKSYEKALTINPNYYQAYNNLGTLSTNLGKLDDAINNYKKAIEINPSFHEAHNNLGNVFKKLGQFDEAVKNFDKAITTKPDFAEAHNNLGCTFKDLNQLDEALKCFERAVEIKPNFAEAYQNLGNVFKDLNQYDAALKSYSNAIAINSDIEYVLGNILVTKMNSCNWDDLPILLNNAKKKILNNEKVVDPFNLMAWSDDPALQRKATEIKVNSIYPINHSSPKINAYLKHKKIRIGYFSADFREHPVAYLTAGLYEAHDRKHFEVHAFSFGPDTKDEMNLRVKAGVDQFHDVQLMSHKEVVLLARSLEIDIAIDLAGLTAGGETEIFSMSAAPIQLSYIGFLGTMGADYYDYLIADPIMIPKKNQKYYSEKIIYLPSFQVNDSKDLPPKISFSRNDVGLPEQGFVFCCFNNTYKFTPDVFDSWARILQSVEGSVLIVYASNDSSKTNLTKEIVRRGVEAERLIFGVSLDRPEYLARYRVADLFLDTQPYNAGTTASDALRMGLPMLTLLGDSYQSRMGASILSALNLPELITTTAKEYESLAIELASNPEKLKAIKDKLASNLSTAPLYNTPLFTKNLESAFTEMYERYHQGLEPDHIYVE